MPAIRRKRLDLVHQPPIGIHPAAGHLTKEVNVEVCLPRSQRQQRRRSRTRCGWRSGRRPRRSRRRSRRSRRHTRRRGSRRRRSRGTGSWTRGGTELRRLPAIRRRQRWSRRRRRRSHGKHDSSDYRQCGDNAPQDVAAPSFAGTILLRHPSSRAKSTAYTAHNRPGWYDDAISLPRLHYSFPYSTHLLRPDPLRNTPR